MDGDNMEVVCYYHNSNECYPVYSNVKQKICYNWCENFIKVDEDPTVGEEKICTYCKIKLDNDALFCKLCGRSIKKSRHIPDSVKREVWRRDGGRCVDCGSKEKLEFHHIIPFSKGGSNTARNIEVLCEKCHRPKGDKI